MNNTPINRLLWFDIETASQHSNWENFTRENPPLSNTFEKYLDWFQKRFPEDSDLPVDQIYERRACLQPEFGKIIVASFGILDKSEGIRIMSYYDENEADLLIKVNKLFNDVIPMNYRLCGHNINNFDIPYLALRMIINGIEPSKIVPKHDTKPWEKNSIDLKEFWGYGRFGAISSLDLMCRTLNIVSPKTDEISGDKVNQYYWEGKIKEIVEYCEEDVKAIVKLTKKLYNIYGQGNV